MAGCGREKASGVNLPHQRRASYTPMEVDAISQVAGRKSERYGFLGEREFEEHGMHKMTQAMVVPSRVMRGFQILDGVDLQLEFQSRGLMVCCPRDLQDCTPFVSTLLS